MSDVVEVAKSHIRELLRAMNDSEIDGCLGCGKGARQSEHHPDCRVLAAYKFVGWTP